MDTDPNHSFDGFLQTMILSQPAVPLAGYTNPQQLIGGMQHVWSAYWAFWASTTMRTPPAPGGSRVAASLSSTRPRLVQDRATTRVMQAFLGALVACLAASARLLARGARRVLLKPPYSIGAQMSMLEGNRLLDDGAAGVMAAQDAEDDGARWPESRLGGYWFRLGWGEVSGGLRRYGVDVVPRP
jgi:hypothetical protein